ncbi:PH domain-containing protein [Dietzia sp.]|uniref:PH domain-containing protein n=1 Tax=Dietzia sp. TaxID=1871616 RepID=UPI002FDA7A2E
MRLAQRGRAAAPVEHLLIETRPHGRALVRPALVAAIGAAIAGAAGGFVELQAPAVDGTDAVPALVAIIALIYALVVLRWTVAPWLRWRGQVFTVTDQRIIGRSGVMRHHRFEMPLSRVGAIRYRHTVSDRMFGTGTLIIDSARGERLEFSDLPRISDIHSVVYELVAAPVRG